jgi:hypothetical protein
MLELKKQNQYIEKMVELPNGAWALVLFELVEKNGKIIARAVSLKKINDIPSENSEILCLPCIKTPIEFLPIRSIFYSILDTFSRDYSFVKSQPTRAPSF